MEEPRSKIKPYRKGTFHYLLSTTSVGAIGVEVRRRDGCSPFRCRRRGLGVMGCCRLEVCTFLEELESLGQIMFNKWSISFALETPGYPLLTPLSEHSRSINSLHVQPWRTSKSAMSPFATSDKTSFRSAAVSFANLAASARKCKPATYPRH